MTLLAIQGDVQTDGTARFVQSDAKSGAPRATSVVHSGSQAMVGAITIVASEAAQVERWRREGRIGRRGIALFVEGFQYAAGPSRRSGARREGVVLPL